MVLLFQDLAILGLLHFPLKFGIKLPVPLIWDGIESLDQFRKN